jgi:hypothetical protein
MFRKPGCVPGGRMVAMRRLITLITVVAGRADDGRPGGRCRPDRSRGPGRGPDEPALGIITTIRYDGRHPQQVSDGELFAFRPDWTARP